MKYKKRIFKTQLALNLLKAMWVKPIQKKTILFISFNGEQYSDSPKYIYEYLKEHYGNQYHYIWAFNEPEKFKDIKGIESIKAKGFQFILKELTVNAIVTNNALSTYLPIRKKQVVLNTWHGGGAIKKFGLTSPDTTDYDDYFFKVHNKKYTAYTGDSVVGVKKIIRESQGYRGIVIKSGMPRNAILQKKNDDVRNSVRLKLGIDRNDFVALYAPTFRGEDSQDAIFDFNALCPDFSVVVSAFQDKYHKNVRILFRGHHAFKRGLSNNDVVDVTNYRDMQELLIAADVLITDYSSCMWDMAVARKPVFLYVPDLKQYNAKPGFLTDYKMWPYVISKSMEELKEKIINFNEDKYSQDLDVYFKRMGSYENKDSLKIACDWLVKKMDQ